jgi:large subunit ribosomal protein L36e
MVLFYHAAACVTKISIVLFLYRLFEPLHSAKTLFYGLGLFYTSLYITANLVNFLQCSPHAASWNLRVRAKGANCGNEFASGLALSIFYAVGDIILVSIPTVTVWRLNLRRTAKFGATFLLSLGGLSCVFCVWKLIYLQGILKNTDPGCKFQIVFS